MFCNNCGKQMADGAAFCPNCGAAQGGGGQQPQNPMQGGQQTWAQPPMGSGMNPQGVALNANIQNYIVKGLVALAAAIMGIMGLVVLVAFFSDLKSTMTLLGWMGQTANIVGIICYVVIGLIVVVCSFALLAPLVRGLMNRAPLRNSIDQALVLTASVFFLYLIAFICSFIFYNTSGSIAGALELVFGIYGNAAPYCLVATIVAAGCLLGVRMKLTPPAQANYNQNNYGM